MTTLALILLALIVLAQVVFLLAMLLPFWKVLPTFSRQSRTELCRLKVGSTLTLTSPRPDASCVASSASVFTQQHDNDKTGRTVVGSNKPSASRLFFSVGMRSTASRFIPRIVKDEVELVPTLGTRKSSHV